MKTHTNNTPTSFPLTKDFLKITLINLRVDLKDKAVDQLMYLFGLNKIIPCLGSEDEFVQLIRECGFNEKIVSKYKKRVSMLMNIVVPLKSI